MKYVSQRQAVICSDMWQSLTVICAVSSWSSSGPRGGRAVESHIIYIIRISEIVKKKKSYWNENLVKTGLIGEWLRGRKKIEALRFCDVTWIYSKSRLIWLIVTTFYGFKKNLIYDGVLKRFSRLIGLLFQNKMGILWRSGGKWFYHLCPQAIRRLWQHSRHRFSS